VEWLAAALLGGLLGLDVVGFPQAMISRPLVAATIAGAFTGDPERGLLLGVVLELIALGTLPFGASRYPEWGSASVVGGVLYAQGTSAPVGALALAVLASLLAAWLSGESMVLLRKLNGRVDRALRPRVERGDAAAVHLLQLGGLTLDFLRGGALTVVALLLFMPALEAILPLWSGGATSERAVLSGLTAALGAATTWMLVRGSPAARGLAIFGLAIGVAWLL
jgi:mannose/fructose/N-acetylgalactosamine-specific phosphotransferase system component IIC